MNKNDLTFYALLSRGFDSNLAQNLMNQQYTVSKLRSMRIKDLQRLGVNAKLARTLKTSSGPSIPVSTVVKLLYDSRYTCCICRDSTKSIVIHHIVKYEYTEDHSENNLVVLCLNHHSEAHTKREIGRNLTQSLVKKLKQRWIKYTEYNDAKTLVGLAKIEGARWDYINHQRLFELTSKFRIMARSIDHYDYLRSRNIIDKSGIINDISSWKIPSSPQLRLYDFDGCIQLYLFMKSTLEIVQERLPIIDITNRWNRTEIKSLIKSGDFICCQGAFYFRNKKAGKYKGRNQIRIGYRKANNILLRFHFDAWECTSSSAWGAHLRSRRLVTSICFVNSILESKRMLEINASCLCIGAYFKDYRTTDYSRLAKFSNIDDDQKFGWE